MKNYIDNSEVSIDCRPDYAERIEKLISELRKDYNVSIAFIKVPEELKGFSIVPKYEMLRKDPTTIKIADTMDQYAILDWLRQHKSRLKDLAAEQTTVEETQELIKKIKESINND